MTPPDTPKGDEMWDAFKAEVAREDALARANADEPRTFTIYGKDANEWTPGYTVDGPFLEDGESIPVIERKVTESMVERGAKAVAAHLTEPNAYGGSLAREIAGDVLTAALTPEGSDD